VHEPEGEKGGHRRLISRLSTDLFEVSVSNAVVPNSYCHQQFTVVRIVIVVITHSCFSLYIHRDKAIITGQ
jgi:hypothetical protein